MSEPFQLADSTPERQSSHDAASPFAKFGYSQNPFPAAGLGLPRVPKYFAHMREQIGQLDEWLREVHQRTSFGRPSQPIQPLALWGTIGIGKSHLLRLIAEGLRPLPGYSVLQISLTEEGMTRLKLADLLLRGLPGLLGDKQDPQSGPRHDLPLLSAIIKHVRRYTDRTAREIFLRQVGQSSPLYVPLSNVCETPAAQLSEQTAWLANWLLRGAVSPTQRTKLGVSGPLEGEGAAIRATADLVRLGHATGTLQVWFILIDQLEDLWRATAISPGRRARFLTDLRLLIDQGLEGSPVALLLAGNSTTMGGDPHRDPLFEEYAALWRRMGNPVQLPGLRAEDIWPFAAKYLDEADSLCALEGRETRRSELRRLLEQQGTPVVLERLRRDALASLNGRFATYRVLAEWKDYAWKLCGS